jgi:hypothetical protein
MGWWAGQDSNLQPDRYERPALTIELPARPGAPPTVKRKTRAVAMMSRMNGPVAPTAPSDRRTEVTGEDGRTVRRIQRKIGRHFLAPAR